MNRKNAFTLTELLAVIVIIGVIATIAIPAYNRYTKSTEKRYYENLEGSVKSSTEEYMQENSYLLPKKTGVYSKIQGKELIKSGIMEKITDTNEEDCEEVNVYVQNLGDGNYNYDVCLKCGSYETEKQICSSNVQEGNGTGDKDTTPPEPVKAFVSNKSSNSITLTAACEDDDSKIIKYSFAIDGDNYIEGTSENYTFTPLEQNKTYRFKVKCENEANLNSESKEITATTGEFNAPTIKEINTNGFMYKESREIEITYNDNEIENPIYLLKSTVDVDVDKDVYYCGGTEEVPNQQCSQTPVRKLQANEWYASSKSVITANYKSVGELQAVLGDGSNLSDKAYYYIKNINNTKPTIKVITEIKDSATRNHLQILEPGVFVTTSHSFEFINLVETDFKEPGNSVVNIGGNTTCNPQTSSVNNIINVTCTAVKNNGLSASVSFKIYVDDVTPKLTAKTDPITLNNKDEYIFTNNLNYEFGVAGKKSITCNPEKSKKTGTYTVTCTAVGVNGKSSVKSFVAKHSYPATPVQKDCNCKNKRVCTGGHEPCDPWACDDCGSWGTCSFNCGKQYFGSTCCIKEEWKTVCDKCTVQTCPSGGTAIGTICYY